MKRKRLGFKISPEMRVEMNREMTYLSSPIYSQPLGAEDLESDMIRVIARRSEELKRRGYPESWIKEDLERLTKSLAS